MQDELPDRRDLPIGIPETSQLVWVIRRIIPFCLILQTGWQQ